MDKSESWDREKHLSPGSISAIIATRAHLAAGATRTVHWQRPISGALQIIQCFTQHRHAGGSSTVAPPAPPHRQRIHDPALPDEKSGCKFQMNDDAPGVRAPCARIPRSAPSHSIVQRVMRFGSCSVSGGIYHFAAKERRGTGPRWSISRRR